MEQVISGVEEQVKPVTEAPESTEEVEIAIAEPEVPKEQPEIE